MQRGHTVSGRVVLVSNMRQSYNVNLELQVDDIPGTFASNTLDLKNPYFRYTGQPIQAPPGCNNTSPSEDYWQQLDANNTNTTALVNGVGATVNGNAILVNGTVLPNGMPVAALNTGIQSLQQPVNLTAQFDPNQVVQQVVIQQQQQQQQAQQQAFTPANAHQAHLLNNQNQSSRVTASPTAVGGISNPYGSPLNVLGTGQILSGVGGTLFQTVGGSANAANVAGINTMNFPVNQSLMIGDYAAAVGGQTIPPYKPM